MTSLRSSETASRPNRLDARSIPVLLLKTRSQPDDTYEELFKDTTTSPSGTSGSNAFAFTPHFIPVLEHTQNATSLAQLGGMLRSGELKRKYGGMIFTSQRAVEAWTDIVHEAEADTTLSTSSRPQNNNDDDAFSTIDSLTPFPLYVVGPATERTLQTLTDDSRRKPNSPLTKLNTSIHGADSGNGAALAKHILSHYNRLYDEHYFTYFEAPRLPFIPLLGMSSQNYGRKRLEKDDPRLLKKPLLFLVGEVRRDIIPRTLMVDGFGAEGRRIEVVETEVYSTVVMEGFEEELKEMCEGLDRENGGEDDVRVVVVFSPQGSDVMLKRVGYLNEQGEVTQKAKKRWWEDGGTGEKGPRWVIVTIGPTTRDYLKDKLGVEPDASASKPSPEGLKQAIEEFLQGKIQQG